MITLLNTSILTGGEGCYSLKAVTLDEAIAEVDHHSFESAIGHKATADILTELLGRRVEVNRIEYKQRPGGLALVFKLRGRPEEGKILSRSEIEQIGYDFFTLRMEPPIELTVQQNQYDGDRPTVAAYPVSQWLAAVRAMLGSGPGNALEQAGGMSDILHINEVKRLLR